MRRYWFDLEDLKDNEIHLHGEVFHHVIVVCRQGVGSKFEMLTSGGKAYLVEVTKLKGKSAWAKILQERAIAPLARPHIHLAVSIPRFQVMDTIVEKAVELGVYEIHPFVSEYSFVRTVDARLRSRSTRWEKIVLGATQQSGHGDLMTVGGPVPLKELLSEYSKRSRAVGLFPFEGAAPQHVRQVLLSLRSQVIDEIWIFVGSEGGYSLAEVELFQSYGMHPTTLGSQVLRVETACLALISILKYEWDLMK
ncbi:MAG: 16S rRNA (uracil(1498)-N(3))-methyltransferase [Bdellovibrionales bacterium]|nr:16S rRNA (uracil(1498)-N(3))-methyltransferase [Bdellovibrionales bacterium]